MNSDEQAIRDVVDRWMKATQGADGQTILSLMTDDVVFLRPGHPPMRKAEFAAGLRAQAQGSAPRFEGQSQIQEVQIVGDWAFMWSDLTVTAFPEGGKPTTRKGNTLTVFRKQDGKWLLARDANMLAPVQS
jgi:uncharacterized protein (TIGR02246 family)